MMEYTWQHKAPIWVQENFQVLLRQIAIIRLGPIHRSQPGFSAWNSPLTATATCQFAANFVIEACLVRVPVRKGLRIIL